MYAVPKVDLLSSAAFYMPFFTGIREIYNAWNRVLECCSYAGKSGRILLWHARFQSFDGL